MTNYDRARLMKGSDVPVPQGARCENCHKVIKDEDAPKGYCCMDCKASREGQQSQAQLRAALYQRDKGVCQWIGPNGKPCRIDTEGLRAELDGLKSKADEGDLKAWNEWGILVRRFLIAGFSRKDLEATGRTLWNAAHLTARVKGGPDTLANVTTACRACHDPDTKQLAKSRAADRKPRGRFGR